MKKALLVTIFRVPNFGSVLQAYATQRVLESIGIECSVLNYDHNESEWARKHGVKGVSLKSKIAIWLGVTPMHRKKKKLGRFVCNHFQLTHRYVSLADIEREEGSAYDVYVAGSDQIWNTKYTNCDPVFLMQFAKKGKKRISIASSFACGSLDARHEDTFRRELQQFDAVSVREQLGQHLLQGLGIGNSHLVLDPTLLLNAHEWKGLYKNTGGGGGVAPTFCFICGAMLLSHVLIYMKCSDITKEYLAVALSYLKVMTNSTRR